MGRGPLPVNTVLGLAPCDWIHTAFVPAPLDVVYCDRAGLVLRVVENLRPWRFGPRVPGAVRVWEAAAGTFAGKVSVGDFIEVRPSAARTTEMIQREAEENGE
jgi:uncharacterized protein